MKVEEECLREADSIRRVHRQDLTFVLDVEKWTDSIAVFRRVLRSLCNCCSKLGQITIVSFSTLTFFNSVCPVTIYI